jgi:hypothetical protein
VFPTTAEPIRLTGDDLEKFQFTYETFGYVTPLPSGSEGCVAIARAR